MRYRTLGSTGTLVSELSLGTMTFGAETPEADAHALLDAYVEAGGNVIDTADVYSAGTSEEIVGRWLAGGARRDDLVVATKARFPMGEGPNAQGLSRPWLRRSVHASLRRLQVEHLDLFQVHGWDPLTPLEETLAALHELVAEGKVRYVGVSNYLGWQLQRAALLARHHGWSPIVALQPQYNLLDRVVEWDLMAVCELEGIGVLPWSPLGGGWLTGKYRREEAPTGATRLGEDPERGVEAWSSRNTERTWRIVDAVREVAQDLDVTPAQVALRWVTDRPCVASTILGVRTAAQLADNLGAVDVRLGAAETARLDEVSALAPPEYPYAFIAEKDAERRRFLRGPSTG